MRGLFWVLALFGLAVAVALGGRLNDGYVLLVFPPWRMEVSFNLFIIAAVLAFAVFYAVLRTLSLTFKLPQRVKAYRERRQRENASEIFQDAVRLLFEGRFGHALKKAAESHALGKAPGLSALVAARAAQRLRESSKQQGWLDRAKLDDPRTEAATLMLEAEMLNESRRFDEAVGVLKRLQDTHGRHLAALRLELRALQGSEDWDGVLRAARQLEKREALPPEVAAEVKLQAHLANIAAHRADSTRLVNCLRAIPARERNGRVVAAAARELMVLGNHGEAQSLIEARLDDGPWEAGSEELVALYGRLREGDATGRIGRAERWLKDRPADAGLLLALGRLCREQRLWGKAQNYFEASLAVAESRDAHLEMAQLMDHLGKPEAANQHYRRSVGVDHEN